MFTQRHFIAVARVIFAEQDFPTRNRQAERFAAMFADVCPRFNRDRFLAAAIDGTGI